MKRRRGNSFSRRPDGRAVRWIGLALSISLAGAALCALALWLTLPPAHSDLHLPGLSAPVDVTLDGWGIPRIHAATEADAATALGYLHARDRMFQMELMRRQASGELAAIAGARAVPLDRMARIFGERRHAEQSYAGLSPELRAILVGYSAGVNAWIAERGRMAASEFLVLGAPEPWTPVDSLLWSETVSLWLSDNYRTELSRAALAGTLAPERLDQLWPPTAGTPAPDGSAAPIRQGLLDVLPAFPDAFAWPSQASNAWAVDGKHTTTGSPLLAGDPHLALGYPSLWYLARIETPAGVLVGATAPGVPFLVIGRNANIAWSFTTTGIDTQDVFVETELPGGRYATPDGPRPFETRQEVIHVRNAADVVLTVRTTRHGPVISDRLPSDPGKPGAPASPVLAVAMSQFKLGSPAPGLFALNHAANVADAGRAAAMMTAPMQNLTVADRASIALFTTGQVPVRRAGDGAVPVAGADGLHDWTGFVGGYALPHLVDPPSGTVENANERTAPPDFPVYLGRDFPAPIRARRIHALLAGKPSFAIADFEAMQRDDVSVFAEDLIPIFRRLPRQTGLTGRVQAMLDAWDGRMDASRAEPLIFNAAAQLFVKQVLSANHVPESDAGPWAGFAEWLLTPAGGAWCGGDCKPVLARALHDATENLATRYGPDPAAWRWGTAHQAVFAHPLLGELPLVGALASRSVAVDGDDTTLFRGGNGKLGAFTAQHGAAYRGIYDLADLERSRFVVTPGQSGNLLSRHAWDLLPLWAAGHTITIPEVPEAVSGTLRMEP